MYTVDSMSTRRMGSLLRGRTEERGKYIDQNVSQDRHQHNQIPRQAALTIAAKVNRHG
jgi:hypothetical protein